MIIIIIITIIIITIIIITIIIITIIIIIIIIITIIIITIIIITIIIIFSKPASSVPGVACSFHLQFHWYPPSSGLVSGANSLQIS